jgi:4-hydroxy-tetrahydrodipicolinate reductase
LSEALTSKTAKGARAASAPLAQNTRKQATNKARATREIREKPMNNKTKVMVIGCCGKMGQTLAQHLLDHPKHSLTVAIDPKNAGQDIGTKVGRAAANLLITSDLSQAISQNKIDVAIDFTTPATVVANAVTCITSRVPIIIGTTGISPTDQKHLEELALKHHTPVLIVPNFALGAILMMDFAKKAAKYMPKVEIIEQHHDQKLDKPSGTALKTRLEILESLGKDTNAPSELVPIHSVRLPGLVAHQEVIFGCVGQTLTIRHDSLSRESFMPGVDLALERIGQISGLKVGLEL